MTQLIGGALPANIIQDDDKRLYPNWAADREAEAVYTVDGWVDYTTDFWPRSSLALGDSGADYGPEPVIRWLQTEITRGRNSRTTFIGVSRDVYNAVLGGVTMKLFRTIDNTLIDTQVSEAVSGVFQLWSPYSDDHYIVAFKAGAPAVEGTTVNTLIGA